MNYNQISEIMKKWYLRADVMFEIIKITKNREMSFLAPTWTNADMKKRNTRMLKCHNTKSYLFHIKDLKVFEKTKIYNFYYTVATYQNGIPNQVQEWTERKKHNLEWNKEHYKSMCAYDFFIDIDCDKIENMDYCFLTAKRLSEMFDNFKIPHEIRFSGMGFHFVIPYEALPKKSLNPNDEHNLYRFLASITEKLYENISEMIDVSIYDSRRLCKIPYSLSIYENNIYVCYPFKTKEEFNKFNIDDYNVFNFNKPIKNEGLHIFNRGGTITDLLDYLRIVNFEI